MTRIGSVASPVKGSAFDPPATWILLMLLLVSPGGRWQPPLHRAMGTPGSLILFPSGLRRALQRSGRDSTCGLIYPRHTWVGERGPGSTRSRGRPGSPWCRRTPQRSGVNDGPAAGCEACRVWLFHCENALLRERAAPDLRRLAAGLVLDARRSDRERRAPIMRARGDDWHVPTVGARSPVGPRRRSSTRRRLGQDGCVASSKYVDRSPRRCWNSKPESRSLAPFPSSRVTPATRCEAL